MKIGCKILGFILLIGCSETANTDLDLESACTQATGTWHMQTTSCGGDNQSAYPMVIAISADNTYTMTRGTLECQKESTYQATHNVPQLSLLGIGYVKCYSEGSEVATCSAAGFSCNNAEIVEGTTLTYNTCVVSQGLTELVRSISEADADTNTQCHDGETETILLNPTPMVRPQLIASTDAATKFYGIDQGASQMTTVHLTNVGDAAADHLSSPGLNTPFSFVGGIFPGIGGTCGSSLPVNTSCTLKITFSPTHEGTFVDNLLINFSNENHSYQLGEPLSGVGLGPNTGLLRFSPSLAYNFNILNVGSYFVDSVLVTNIGNGPASAISGQPISSTEIKYEGGIFPGTNGTCGATLNVDESCILRWEFAMTMAGLKNVDVVLNYHNGTSMTTAKIQIIGQATP